MKGVIELLFLLASYSRLYGFKKEHEKLFFSSKNIGRLFEVVILHNSQDQYKTNTINNIEHMQFYRTIKLDEIYKHLKRTTDKTRTYRNGK